MTVPPAALAAATKACPFINRDALHRALTAAQPAITAAERDRIRQLASGVLASYRTQPEGDCDPSPFAREFADLLGGDQ
jgi:hypothetical protein